jgi:hypothetical protein
MIISPLHAYVLAQAVAGRDVNGQADGLPEPLRSMVAHLGKLPLPQRSGAWTAMLAAITDRERLVQAIAAVRRNEPPPAAEEWRPANLGDISVEETADQMDEFVWNHWLVKSHLNVISSDPKMGKTRFALDLCGKAYSGKPSPDGAIAKFAPGARSLWVLGDRHHVELRKMAAAFGIPLEAIMLNALPDEPRGGCDLDLPSNVELLATIIERMRPIYLVIDTLWRASRRHLYREDEVNELFNPIIELCQQYETTILALMHLSKDQETLGRRLEGMARSIIKISAPDLEQPNRRRIEVKGNFEPAPPLGMTIRADGCDYDSEPPAPAVKNRSGGKPAEKQTNAKAFICSALEKNNDQIGTELCAQWEKSGGSHSTFWRAVDELRADGKIVSDGGPGSGQRMRLHLYTKDPESPY